MADTNMMRRLKRRKMLRQAANLVLLYGGMTALAVILIIPFLWTLSTSLKHPAEVFAFPPRFIPQQIHWRNYADAWMRVPFGRYFINSIIVSCSVTLGQVFTSALAAFAFARLDFPGRNRLFLGYLGTMMIPGQVTMIPVFIVCKQLNLIDTYAALILPGLFSAYGTFMLRQFFLTIPKDLEEAAIIDGLNYWQIFIHVIVPLSKPALFTLGTFVFLGAWNDFMWPLIVTNADSMKTLPVGLAAFQGQYSTDWTLLMAGSVIVLTPVLLLYIVNQRFITKGFVMSGLKG